MHAQGSVGVGTSCAKRPSHDVVPEHTETGNSQHPHMLCEDITGCHPDHLLQGLVRRGLDAGRPQALHPGPPRPPKASQSQTSLGLVFGLKQARTRKPGPEFGCRVSGSGCH